MIEQKTMSEYALGLVLACRNNPDNTMPFNSTGHLYYENNDGTIEKREVIGGVSGRLGSADISSIKAATGVYLEFVELNKKDKVHIDLSSVPNPDVATVANICEALNKSINKFDNFPIIKHGFHASVRNNRIFINADIPIETTGIPVFVNGSHSFSSTTTSVTIKEGDNTADTITVTTDDTNPTLIADFIDDLNTAIAAASFPNAKHTFKAYEDNGKVLVKTGLEIPSFVPLTIQNSHDSNGEVDSIAAEVLELDRSYWRAIRNSASITVANDVTDSEEIGNESATKVVTTIKTDQQETGKTITLVDAEKNVYNQLTFTGGHFDGKTYTPKKRNANSPLFGLLCFSPIFDEGTYSFSGNSNVVMTIYPSCTAVLESDDKNQKAFNQASYSIVASDSSAIAAGTKIYIGKDLADEYTAMAESI